MRQRTALRILVALAVTVAAFPASLRAAAPLQIPGPTVRRQRPPEPEQPPAEQDPDTAEPEAADERQTPPPDSAEPVPESATEPAPEPERQTAPTAAPIAPVSAPTSSADGGLRRRIRLGLTVGDGSGGAVVLTVAPRSPSATAGVREGDVIVRVNAETVGDAAAFQNRLRFMHAGEPVSMAAMRAGEPVEMVVVPEEAVREGDLVARVEYSSFTSGSVRLRSVWSVPQRGEGRRPAVLVVRGVGASASDAPGENPFREIAFRLARAGVIAVRYDPQGVGDSDGSDNAAVDFNGEVAEARAALAHVREDPRVDPDRVVLLGHGTGGGVAAVVARSDGRLAGLAVVGTIARPMMEYLLDSRRQQMALAGLPPGDVDDILREHVTLYAGILSDGRATPGDPYGIVADDGTVMGKSAEFWRQYDQVNFGRLFTELKAPVLNAIGEFDFVSTLADHRAIADALRAKGQAGPAIVLLDQVDHDLRTHTSREAAFAAFGSTEAPVSVRAVVKLVDWVGTTTAASGAEAQP